MSKLNKYSKKDIRKEYKDSSVTNFMGGTSYTLNPLETLKIVATSSIFGEPSYYRVSSVSRKQFIPDFAFEYMLFDKSIFDMTTEELFETTINEALDYDFKATLDFAVELRNEYLMRLNPAVIFVKAVMHDNRVSFNEENPGYLWLYLIFLSQYKKEELK